VEIEQQRVEWGGAVSERAAGVGQGPRQAHPIAELLQVGAQQEPDVGLVVYDEQVPLGRSHGE
jgi:hypothetical protein